VSLWLFFGVNPEPWTVGLATPVRRAGKVSSFMSPDPQLVNYKKALQQEFDLNYSSVLMALGPVQLDLYFYRRLDRYDTEAGRKSQRHVSDATNLQKAFEDAMQGKLYENDRQVVDVHSRIMEQTPETIGCTVMRIDIVGDTHFERIEERGFPETMTHALFQHRLAQSSPLRMDNSW